MKKLIKNKRFAHGIISGTILAVVATIGIFFHEKIQFVLGKVLAGILLFFFAWFLILYTVFYQPQTI